MSASTGPDGAGSRAKRPCSSVATLCVCPFTDQVTVAPGNGLPEEVTTPEVCPKAMQALAAAAHTTATQFILVVIWFWPFGHIPEDADSGPQDYTS